MSNMTIIQDADYDRRKFIGSSNVAAILGLGVYDNTALTVWKAKTSTVADVEAPQEDARRKFLERRKRWEPYVVDRLREEMGAEIIATNVRYIDLEVPYFAAEIDAEAKYEGEVINVEIKTVSPFAFGHHFGWGEQGTDDIPIHYDAQVRFALGVTRRRRSLVVAMVGLMDEFPIYVVDRDEAVESEIRGACQRFWENHVLANVPPDPQTLHDLKILYKTSNGVAVDGTGEIGSKAMRLRAIRAQMEALEFEHDAMEFDVKAFMRDREELIVNGKRLFTWKEQNWSDLDETALKTKFKEAHKACTIGPTSINPETGQQFGKRRVFKGLKS